MFTYSIYFFSFNLTKFQRILYYLLGYLIWKIDVPLFPEFPLMNFSLNFNLFVTMALNHTIPQKFIDFSLDASEAYYYEYNTNSEFIYYSLILFSSPKHYWLLLLICFFYLFFKSWKLNFIYWAYAISLPFVFLCIFLYIDYLDGYFD